MDKFAPLKLRSRLFVLFPYLLITGNCVDFLEWLATIMGFVQNFSSVVAPLTDLISPKIPFEWTTASQEAFEGAKALLANAPVLTAADFS